MPRSRRAEAIIGVLGDRPIAYHPGLAIALTKLNPRCGAKDAIWISQMLYWDGKGELRGNWIYKTRESWTDELGLSRCEQESVRRHLKELGIQEERLMGMPARMAYRLNFDRLTLLAELAYAEDEDHEQALVREFKALLEASPVGGKPTNKMAESPPTEEGIIPQQDCGLSPNMIAEKSPRSEMTPETTPQDDHERSGVISGDKPLLASVDKALKERLKGQMVQEAHDKWICPIRLRSIGEGNLPGQVVIHVPNEQVQEWLETRISVPVRRTLYECLWDVAKLKLDSWHEVQIVYQVMAPEEKPVITITSKEPIDLPPTLTVTKRSLASLPPGRSRQKRRSP